MTEMITAELELSRTRSRPTLRKLTGLDKTYRFGFLGDELSPKSTHSKHYLFEVTDVEGTFFEDHRARYYVLEEGGWLLEVDRKQVIQAFAPADLQGELRAHLQNEDRLDMRIVLNQAEHMCCWASSEEDILTLRRMVQGWERTEVQKNTGLRLPNLEGSEKQVVWAESIRAKYLEALLALQGQELEEIEEARAEGADIEEEARVMRDMVARVFDELVERVIEVTSASSFIDARDLLPRDTFGVIHPEFRPTTWKRAITIDGRFDTLEQEALAG